MVLDKKKVKGWSLRAKCAAYRCRLARVKEAEADVRLLHATLLSAIVPGYTAAGIRHKVFKSKKILASEVVRLGYFEDVRSDAIDEGKLTALVKLHPELAELVYEMGSVSHHLVVRDLHK